MQGWGGAPLVRTWLAVLLVLAPRGYGQPPSALCPQVQPAQVCRERNVELGTGRVESWQTLAEPCDPTSRLCVACTRVTGAGRLIQSAQHCLQHEYFVACNGVDGAQHECRSCVNCGDPQSRYASGCGLPSEEDESTPSPGTCTPTTSCGAGKCELVAPTATSDRVCVEVAAGTASPGGNLPCRGHPSLPRGESCRAGTFSASRNASACLSCPQVLPYPPQPCVSPTSPPL